MEASEDGIYFDDSKLQLAISKGILSDHLNNISDETISNSKKKKSVSLHPLTIFVGNLPYSEDLALGDYRFRRGLFAKACVSGRRPWKLEKRYKEDLEECLNNALIQTVSLQLFRLLLCHSCQKSCIMHTFVKSQHSLLNLLHLTSFFNHQEVIIDFIPIFLLYKVRQILDRSQFSS